MEGEFHKRSMLRSWSEFILYLSLKIYPNKILRGMLAGTAEFLARNDPAALDRVKLLLIDGIKSFVVQGIRLCLTMNELFTPSCS